MKKDTLVIFIDSKFRHRYNWGEPPKYKVLENIARDKKINATLKKSNWTIVQFWGRSIMKNILCMYSSRNN